jgi:hypothetical protein
MEKVCACGGTEFTVELRRYDSYARAANQVNMVEEVSKITCVSCGNTYRYNP